MGKKWKKWIKPDQTAEVVVWPLGTWKTSRSRGLGDWDLVGSGIHQPSTWFVAGFRLDVVLPICWRLQQQGFSGLGAARRRLEDFFEVRCREDMCEHNIFGVDDTCGNMGGWFSFLKMTKALSVSRVPGAVDSTVFFSKSSKGGTLRAAFIVYQHLLNVTSWELERIWLDSVVKHFPKASEIFSAVCIWLVLLHHWNRNVFVSISGCTFGVW